MAMGAGKDLSSSPMHATEGRRQDHDTKAEGAPRRDGDDGRDEEERRRPARRSVSFSPAASPVHTRPSTRAAERRDLFYTADEIARFRRESEMSGEPPVVRVLVALLSLFAGDGCRGGGGDGEDEGRAASSAGREGSTPPPSNSRRRSSSRNEVSRLNIGVL